MSYPKVQVNDEENRLAIRFLRKRTSKFNWGKLNNPQNDDRKEQIEKPETLKVNKLPDVFSSKLKINMLQTTVQTEDKENRLAIRFLCKRTKKFNWGKLNSSPADDYLHQIEKPKIPSIQNLNKNSLLKLKKSKESNVHVKLSNFKFLSDEIIIQDDLLKSIPNFTIQCKYCRRNFSNQKVYSIHVKTKHSTIVEKKN